MMNLEERFVKKTKKPIGMGALSAMDIIVDNETGVNYMFYVYGNTSGLTVIVDKNGKPYISD
jgi:hypothetical protein